MKVMIVLLLFLTSCVKDSSMSVEEVDLKLTQEWIYALKLENLKYNDVVITRPPGFEQLVMSLLIPNIGGLSDKRHCLYYQVPYKEKKGNLKVLEFKNGRECPDSSAEENAFISLEDVNNLKVKYANFKVNLNFDYKSQKRDLTIPLPNVEAGLVHEKYRALSEKRLISGLTLLRLTDDSFDFASNKYLGKLSDRFARGSAIRCQHVNKDCETVGENRCGECRYGWYEVVDFQCPQGGSKFCGQNHCGEKNEPACPRGIKVVDIEDAGICQSDLEPVPNADKILICQ